MRHFPRSHAQRSRGTSDTLINKTERHKSVDQHWYWESAWKTLRRNTRLTKKGDSCGSQAGKKGRCDLVQVSSQKTLETVLGNISGRRRGVQTEDISKTRQCRENEI